jgi:hypothetical protein
MMLFCRRIRALALASDRQIAEVRGRTRPGPGVIDA